MEVYQWLCVLALPNLVGWFWTTILNRKLKKKDEENSRKHEEIRRQNELLEEQNKALMHGIQALLRDRLLQGYKEALKKGYADYDNRKNMENIWGSYHTLGQNGAMDSLRIAYLALPVYKNDEEMEVDEDE